MGCLIGSTSDVENEQALDDVELDPENDFGWATSERAEKAPITESVKHLDWKNGTASIKKPGHKNDGMDNPLMNPAMLLDEGDTVEPRPSKPMMSTNKSGSADGRLSEYLSFAGTEAYIETKTERPSNASMALTGRSSTMRLFNEADITIQKMANPSIVSLGPNKPNIRNSSTLEIGTPGSVRESVVAGSPNLAPPSKKLSTPRSRGKGNPAHLKYGKPLSLGKDQSPFALDENEEMSPLAVSTHGDVDIISKLMCQESEDIIVDVRPPSPALDDFPPSPLPRPPPPPPPPRKPADPLEPLEPSGSTPDVKLLKERPPVLAHSNEREESSLNNG